MPALGAPHRPDRIGVEPAERRHPGAGFLHPVTERRDPDIAAGSTERSVFAASTRVMPSGYSVNAWPPTTRSSGLSMSRSSATASPSSRARSASRARACWLPCLAARSTAVTVDAGPSAGMMRAFQAAISSASSLTVDSSSPLPPAVRMGLQRGDGAGAAGRCVDPRRRSTAHADRLARVHVQGGRRWSRSRRTPSRSRRPPWRRRVQGHQHRQAQRIGEHRADRRVGRAEPEWSRCAGWCCQRQPRGRTDPTAGRRRASGSDSGRRCRPAVSSGPARRAGSPPRPVQRPAEEVGRHDARGPGAMWMPSVRKGSSLTSTGTQACRWRRGPRGPRAGAGSQRRARGAWRPPVEMLSR